jgi:threonine/homoserine/homoserine lactone efflux protein
MAEEIHDITSAQQGLSDELPGRARRYFIAMMIRTASFIAAVILPSPFRWIALAGAVFLPYFAVVIANAGRESIAPGSAVLRDNRKSLS